MSDSDRDPSARHALAAVIIALTIVSIAFRTLTFTRLEHTSLVFIGIPALLSLALMRVDPKTTLGMLNKTIALALCMAGILFGEGFICILMAAPIFFVIGALVHWLDRKSSLRLGVLLLVPLSLEGVLPGFELRREETVTETRVIRAAPDAVQRLMKEELDAVMHSRESVEAAAQGSASSGHGTTAVGTISHLRHSRT